MCFMKIQSSTCDRVPSEVDDGGWPLASKVQLNCATFFPCTLLLIWNCFFIRFNRFPLHSSSVHQVSTNKIHTIHNPKLIYMQYFFVPKVPSRCFFMKSSVHHIDSSVFSTFISRIFSPHFFSVNTKPFG